ncbi:NERD domain-containing protein [Rossellomorea vietnamensis]|uniref:NERD domain-containing protein n=1 Tax=Rossellomorea vietnamensis TaxID=218284 RepID=UPI001E2E39C3|nr:NERD domain-containing protein [Rossellomorea vietnamensis]MCC5804665.1 NERD domain-containing protein [Rossellomorea vietnamensis]
MKKVFITVLAIIILLPILLFLTPMLMYLLPIAGIILLKVKAPVIKGAIGERRVNSILTSLGEDYNIYNDLYVPNGQGGTTQVDHVVTSPYGIFVIETKNYQGWIFGKENQRYWTQTIYQRKEKLFNPIWQNYGHIQALKSCIGKEDLEFIYSIIAFSQKATLKCKDDFTSARVITFGQLTKVIKEWNVQRITYSELKDINQVLEGLIITDKKEKNELKKKHIKDIRNNRKDRDQKGKERIHQNVCPKCSGELTRRRGKYGSFYGCSRFPKCRYTKQVS